MDLPTRRTGQSRRRSESNVASFVAHARQSSLQWWVRRLPSGEDGSDSIPALVGNVAELARIGTARYSLQAG